MIAVNGANITISGWYGNKNMGDESILLAILQTINNDDSSIKICVLSNDPQYTELVQKVAAVRHLENNIHAYVPTIVNGDLFRTLNLFRKTDVFILGGGGFLSDWQSWIVMAEWLFPAILIKFFGGKTMLYAAGVGPIRTSLGKFWTRFVFNNFVHVITVRDERSKEWLKSSGVKKDVIVTSDPAIRLVSHLKDNGHYQTPHRPIDKVKRVGVIVTPYFDRPQYWPKGKTRWKKLRKAYIDIIQGLLDRNMDVALIPFQVPVDLDLAMDIRDEMAEGNTGNMVVMNNRTPIETLDALNDVDLVISVRMHGCVLAASLGIPMIGIIYHHKTEEFLSRIGMLDYAMYIGEEDGQDLDPTTLLEKFDSLVKEYHGAKMMLDMRVLEEQEKERNNLTLLKTLMVSDIGRD